MAQNTKNTNVPYVTVITEEEHERLKDKYADLKEEFNEMKKEFKTVTALLKEYNQQFYATKGDPQRDFIDRFPATRQRSRRTSAAKPYCTYCKKTGHTRTNCYMLRRQGRTNYPRRTPPPSFPRAPRQHECFFCCGNHFIDDCPEYNTLRIKAIKTARQNKSVNFSANTKSEN